MVIKGITPAVLIKALKEYQKVKRIRAKIITIVVEPRTWLDKNIAVIKDVTESRTHEYLFNLNTGHLRGGSSYARDREHEK